MKELIEIKFIRKFKEYIYSEGDYIGKIIVDSDGDYLFKSTIFFTSRMLGRGKVLKKIAERLIKLNYGKEVRK